MEDDLKKMKWKTISKKKEEDLKKKGRRPQTKMEDDLKKNGRQPQKNEKMEDDHKYN